jgi:hypothetical protein
VGGGCGVLQLNRALDVGARGGGGGGDAGVKQGGVVGPEELDEGGGDVLLGLPGVLRGQGGGGTQCKI